MSRRYRRYHPRRRHDVPRPASKPTVAEFVEVLEDNEDHMPEMAAMALTCEQFEITEEEGYDLLLADSQGAEL